MSDHTPAAKLTVALRLLREVLGSTIHEDEYRSNDQLFYSCVECGREAWDDPWKIDHQSNCVYAPAWAFLARFSEVQA